MCIILDIRGYTVSKKTYNFVTGIIGGVQVLAIAIVTYISPENIIAINASIGIVGTAAIEVCNQFVKSE